MVVGNRRLAVVSPNGICWKMKKSKFIVVLFWVFFLYSFKNLKIKFAERIIEWRYAFVLVAVSVYYVYTIRRHIFFLPNILLAQAVDSKIKEMGQRSTMDKYLKVIIPEKNFFINLFKNDFPSCLWYLLSPLYATNYEDAYLYIHTWNVVWLVF